VTDPLAASGPDHWFEPLADHMGSAYLRYSFTKGTRQECDALVDALALVPGMRVLDVGCGPGRHAHELARRGIVVHGVDISERFIEIARSTAPVGATFERADARSLAFNGEFDAAICLCQGAFGLLGPDSENLAVLSGIARAIAPGGRAAVSAFNAYFRVKYQGDTEFDAVTGVSHENTEIRDSAGVAIPAELWTTCFTPRELRLLAAAAGLTVDGIWSVEPGSYRAEAPSVETPEFLLLAHRD
jgi:2-polyprenyl-3-methyl-5-hydroxy-6-metoxy-1,4-benzoquinol methylase